MNARQFSDALQAAMPGDGVLVTYRVTVTRKIGGKRAFATVELSRDIVEDASIDVVQFVIREINESFTELVAGGVASADDMDEAQARKYAEVLK